MRKKLLILLSFIQNLYIFKVLRDKICIKDKLDNSYYDLYITGLLITSLYALLKFIIIILVKIIPKAAPILKIINSDFVSIFLLLISASIIILMYFDAKEKLDISINSKNRTFYKEYIQLEGYLQTLIGFFIAILSLISFNNEPNISEVSFPIGIALITSILGWYFGGDIAPPKEDKINKSLNELDNATEGLYKNINLLSKEIFQTKNKYENTTIQFVENSTNLYKSQENSIKEYKTSLDILQLTNKNYRTEITQSLNNLKDSLNNYQKDYEKSIISLNQKVFDIQERNQEKIIEGVENYFRNLNIEFSKGSRNIELFNASFNTYLDSIKNIFKISNNELVRFIGSANKYNETIVFNTKASNEILNNINNGFKKIENDIKNLKANILDDLYENHSLRNDLKQINESIQNLKLNKTSSFLINFLKIFNFKNWFKKKVKK